MKSHFQDIIPPEKRSIRNIPITTKEKKVAAEETYEEEEVISREKFSFSDRKSSRKTPRFVVWGIVCIAALGVVFAVSSLWSKAVVTIATESFEVPVEKTFPIATEPSNGELSYVSVSVSDSLSETLPATGEKEATSKASGTIIIYNNYAKTAQTLVANTRFETPDGLIYRIQKQVSVPGQKTEAGKLVPGSVEAIVVADQAGSSYNKETADFTIPGFEGTAQYDKFYARTKTPITGGASGKVAVVEEEALAAAVASMRTKLEASLREKASSQLPEGLFTVPGLSEADYRTHDATIVEGGNALVKIDGTLKVYALSENEFAASILSGAEAEIKNFDVSGEKLTGTLSTASSTTVDIKGEAILKAVVPRDEVKAEIAKKSKSDALQILSEMPGIREARIVVKPFWLTTVPEKAEKIEIITE